MILLSGIISFAFCLNVFNLLISDRYSFYKMFLEPVKFILIHEWIYAVFFIIGFPAILLYFLFTNRDLLFSRSLLIGLTIGIFLHQYVQLLETLRLDVGPVVNFLAYYSSKFYMEQHSVNSRWAMQIFNLPGYFYP